MSTPAIMTRQQHQEHEDRLAHARQQLVRLEQAEADQRAHVERTRPRLSAAEAAYQEAKRELQAARLEFSHGDSLGFASARRRGDLQRQIEQLEADLAESHWAGR